MVRLRDDFTEEWLSGVKHHHHVTILLQHRHLHWNQNVHDLEAADATKMS